MGSSFYGDGDTNPPGNLPSSFYATNGIALYLNGNVVRYGSVAPSASDGYDGDFYINTSNSYLYGPKASGVWPSGISIVGPQGPQGPPGSSGAGTGDVVGPATNSDNYIPQWNGVNSKTLKNGLPVSTFLQTANNLSDVANAGTSRTNLGVAIGSNVQAWSANLDTFAALGNWKVVYTNSTGVPVAVALSVAGTTLVSTGTTSAPTMQAVCLTANNLNDLANAGTSRTNLGLGTAATFNAGTGANNIVQLDGSSKLPAVDGSQLTNLLPAASYMQNVVGRNGGMEVWQRGAGDSASIAVAASSTLYTADGWYLKTGANQAFTVSAQTGITTNSYRCARVQRNSGQTGTGTVYFAFPLDTDEIMVLRGNSVKLIFTTSTGANWSPTSGTLTYTLYAGTAAVSKRNSSAYSGEASLLSGSVNLATSASAAQTVSALSTTSSTMTCAELQFSFSPAGTAGANDWVQIDDVALVILPSGSSATPTFDRVDMSWMLTRCQRHFWKTYNYNTAPGNNYGGTNAGALSFSGSTSQVSGGFSIPPMRSAPTFTAYDGVGTAGKVDYYAGGWNNNGAITNSAATTNSARLGKFDVSATIITFDAILDAGI